MVASGYTRSKSGEMVKRKGGGASRFSPFKAAHFVQRRENRQRGYIAAVRQSMNQNTRQSSKARKKLLRNHSQGSQSVILPGGAKVNQRLKPLRKLIRNSGDRPRSFKVS